MKLHILAHLYRSAALTDAVDNGTITADDEVWRGDAGDLIVGQVPQDEDAGDYIFAGTVEEYITRSAAAAALGSARSERKAAASRENGKLGGRPRLTIEERARQRVNRSKRLARWENVIFYDWPEGDDHLRWIATAKVSEIEDWAEVISQPA